MSNTRDGRRIGEVNFRIGSNGEVEPVTLSGSVPGTEAVANRLSIVNKVASIRAADRHAYISRKMADALRQATGGVR